MADKIEQAEIRGLQIDKAIKGIAEIVYSFKDDLEVSTMTGDSLRWYQETFGDLTATSPMRVANIAALTTFTTLEKDWTRNTSYSRKYGATDKISDEDLRTADIDVLTRTLRALTRAVMKQTDTRIFNVVTNSLAGVTAAVTDVNLITTSGSWQSSASNPIKDLLNAQKYIYLSGGYDATNPVVWLHPTDHVNLKSFIINTKGSSIPAFSSSEVTKGTTMQLLGMSFKVSPNATSGKPIMIIPKLCASWKTAKGLTSAVVVDEGIGKEIRVWEDGEAILTAPKAVCVISGAA